MHRARLNVVVVHQTRRFLFHEELHRFLDLHLARARAPAAEILKHALQLTRHFLHAGRRKNLHPHRRRAQLHFDLLLIEAAFAQLLAIALACRAVVGAARFGADGETDLARGRQ